MSIIDRELEVCAQNYTPLPIVLTKGSGVWVHDADGHRYLDMMSGYSAVSMGHCHPRLVRALTAQAKRLAVTSRAFHTDKLAPFLEKLCDIVGLDRALPMNTGAEAVETAIKAARRWGYQVKGIPRDSAEIIVADGNFHGRTTTIISASSDSDYQRDFGPLTPGFKIAPFGDIDAFEQAITGNTCAILVEPIQGEAGIQVPPSGWLGELRSVCDKHNVLLLVDEIQSGLGRTGKMFAFEHEEIIPDGVMVGKALGGGLLPVSAFVAKREIMDLFDPGSHGSTFGGNPLAAVVGLEALHVLEEEGLAKRSEVLGEHLMEGLADLAGPVIKEVRGRGLWVGVEIDSSVVDGKTFCKLLARRGVLTKETHDSVVRFAPPLVIKKNEIDWALEQIGATLDDVASARERNKTGDQELTVRGEDRI